MKKLSLFIFLSACFYSFSYSANFKSGTNILVDGVYNSTQAVISGRQPVISWEYTSIVSSFTIVVSTDNTTFNATGEKWSYVGSTTTSNTINSITRISYDSNGAGSGLTAGEVYCVKVALFEDGTEVSKKAQFTAVSSVVEFTGTTFDLMVDWNNPFNPADGKYTVFRFTAKDRDRKLKLRVFTLSGELVQEWPEVTVLKDAWQTQMWDGRNFDNQIVARGVYFVNLMDVGDKTGITRRVAVIKK